VNESLSFVRWRRAWLTGACALALGVAAGGCGNGDGPAVGGGTDAVPARTAWPQPVGGKLTTDMCDVLGPDDYHAAGAIAATFDERKLIQPRTLSCHSVGENWLVLDLQPDAVSGGLYFQAQRHEHKTTSELRENVVPGADESWYDAEGTSHTLVARRGGLLVRLSFGFLNDDVDRFKAATMLTGLVLERLPQVGATDTGKPHQLVLTVTGNAARTGPVDITYTEPNLNESVQEKGVTLPYVKKLDFAWFGQSRVTQIMAAPRKPVLNNYLTCRIVLDGETIGEQVAVVVPMCSGSYSEKD
jgi:hypothetical protein